MSFIDEIKQKILARYKKIPSRCFVLGNGPSLNNIDLDLLQNEITIACNHFMEGLYEKNKLFIPTIICGGDGSLLRDSIRKKFNWDSNNLNSFDLYKKTIIYIYHAGALIRNCYDIKNWTTLCPHRDINNITQFGCECKYTKPYDITQFQEIMDSSDNFYLIQDFNLFKLTKNIKSILGSKEHTEQILKNYTYCYRFSNVIPMISLLIAQELGFKHIYLVGCDGQKFDSHFYVKVTGKSLIDVKPINEQETYYNKVIKGMENRYEILRNKDIRITSCFETVYNFIPFYDINNFINTHNFSGIDNTEIINEYHEYVNNNDTINPRNFISKVIKRKNCNYSHSNICLAIGPKVNLKNINLNHFKDCPIISVNGTNAQLNPFITYYSNEDSILKNTETPNDNLIIYNLKNLTNKTDQNILDKIQTHITSDQDTFVIQDINIPTISKIISPQLIQKIDTPDQDVLFAILDNLKFNYVLMLGLENAPKSRKFKNIKTIVNLKSKHLQNPFLNLDHIDTIDIDAVLNDISSNIIGKIRNYCMVTQIKSDENMKLIVDAVESIIVGNNNNCIQDYINIKQNIK